MTVTAYSVSGMHCDHCVTKVRSGLSGLEGVSTVTVKLVPEGDSVVSVDSAAPLERHAVRSAIASAGFTLTS